MTTKELAVLMEKRLTFVKTNSPTSFQSQRSGSVTEICNPVTQRTAVMPPPPRPPPPPPKQDIAFNGTAPNVSDESLEGKEKVPPSLLSPPPPPPPPPASKRSSILNVTTPKASDSSLEDKENESTKEEKKISFAEDVSSSEAVSTKSEEDHEERGKCDKAEQSTSTSREASSSSSFSFKFISSVFSSKSTAETTTTEENTKSSSSNNINNTEDVGEDDDDEGGAEESGSKRHVLNFTEKGIFIKHLIELNLYKARIVYYAGIRKKFYKCKKFTKVTIDNCQVCIYLSGKSKSFTLETKKEAEKFILYIEYIMDSGLQLKPIFDHIDVESKGYLTVDNLVNALRSMGLPYNREVAEKMLASAMIESETVDFYGFFHVLVNAPCPNLKACLIEWYSRAFRIPMRSLQLFDGETLLSPEETVYFTACAGKNFQNSHFLRGQMVFTNYRIYFRSYQTLQEGHPSTRLSIPERFTNISIPYASIHKLRITNEPTNLLNIISENFFTVFFFFPRSIHNLSKLEASLKTINATVNGTDIQKITFAFYYQPQSLIREQSFWPSERLAEEFKRQGLNDTSPWKIVENENYSLCASYPRLLVVPAECNANHLHGSVKYRSSGRFPVITYIYENSVVLVRCAQPLAGVFRKSSMDDVHLLSLFRLKGSLQGDGKSRLYIIDARGVVASSANALMGKGTEDVSSIVDTELVYGSVDNIHEMRACAKQLSEFLSPTFDPFGDFKEFTAPCETTLTQIEAWLKHVRQIMSLAVFAIGKMVLEESSVLVHCSDGWDRTTQICALTQVLLDPYYRTIEGFSFLIEKDWCAFGHKFHDRTGRNKDKPDERSPIFLQFLDCVYQVINQFPSAFEYNQEYLIFLADHSHSGLFGNFLGNNEKERVQIYKVSTTTYSIWDFAFAKREQFTNKFYEREGDRVLWPSVLLHEMRLWSRFWCRWNLSSNPRSASHSWIEDW